MATKEFKNITKENVDLLKKLSTIVPDTSNSSDYFKFLEKTMATLKTFDKEDNTYVDYVAKAMSKKHKAVEKKKAAPKVPKTPKSKAKNDENDDEKKSEDKAEEKKKARARVVPVDNSKKRKADEDSDEPTKKKVKNA